MVRPSGRLRDLSIGLALLAVGVVPALGSDCDIEGTCSSDDTGLLQALRKARASSGLALSEPREMKLHVMEDKGLGSDVGAVCLDGSPGAFYFSPGVGSDADNWLIFLEGGGWCTSVWDCYVRANNSGSLGSSKAAVDVITWGNTGINSLNCSVSPFCNYSQVYVKYCDGTSYSGNKKDPVIVRDSSNNEVTKLYFRGQRIFDAVVDTLLKDFGLTSAKKVLFSGCSAGGLGALLHADHLYDLLQAGVPTLDKYGTVPVSGFFLDEVNARHDPLYPSQLEQLFALSNWTTLYARCEAAYGEAAAQCNFAANAFKYIRTPIFLINSALDWWQTKCVLGDGVWDNGACQLLEEFQTCAANITLCTGNELAAMNGYMDSFMKKAQGGRTLSQKGNGAFINSCHYHCEGAHDLPFLTFAVNGVTIKDAVAKWWESDGEEAMEHTYMEQCRYGQGVECNPTCTVFVDPLFR